MSVYLVTWDLNKEKFNYTQARKNFLDRLQQYDHKKDQGLDSVAFVSTSLDVTSLSGDLKMALDDNDRLMVVKISNGNHQGWLDQLILDWINARL